jgi:hypothetical protein
MSDLRSPDLISLSSITRCAASCTAVTAKLKAGVPPNRRIMEKGSCGSIKPIAQAAADANEQVVAVLLKFGAKPNETSCADTAARSGFDSKERFTKGAPLYLAVEAAIARALANKHVSPEGRAHHWFMVELTIRHLVSGGAVDDGQALALLRAYGVPAWGTEVEGLYEYEEARTIALTAGVLETGKATVDWVVVPDKPNGGVPDAPKENHQWKPQIKDRALLAIARCGVLYLGESMCTDVLRDEMGLKGGAGALSCGAIFQSLSGGDLDASSLALGVLADRASDSEDALLQLLGAGAKIAMFAQCVDENR